MWEFNLILPHLFPLLFAATSVKTNVFQNLYVGVIININNDEYFVE